MRRFLVLGVLAAGLLGAGFIQPVQAQEECTPVDSFSVPGDVSTYTSGTYETLTDHTYLVIVSGLIQFGSSEDSLTDPQYLTLDGTFGDLIRQNQVQFSTSDAPDADDDTYNPEHEYTFTRSGNGSPIGLRFLDTEYGDNSLSWDVEVQECGGGGGPAGFTRPIATADEHPQWGMYDGDYVNELDPTPDINFPFPESVYAFSNKANADVSAVASGTVIDVIPFSPATECPAGTETLRLCFLIIPKIISQELDPLAFSWETTNVSRVVVRDDIDPTITYTYLVQFAKVDTGDRVVAGCVIGQTVQMKNLAPGEVKSVNAGLSASPGGASLNAGVTIEPRSLLLDVGFTFLFMKQGGDTLSLFPGLVLPPDQSNCKSQVLSGCATTDPDLTRLDNWKADDGVTLLPGGGVSIPPDRRIVQENIVVDPEQTYSLNIQAKNNGAGGDEDITRVKLTAGLQSQLFIVDSGWKTYSLTLTGSDWLTDTNLTTVSVANGGEDGPFGADIYVRYICLANSSIDTAPGSCYFANHEFDSDGAGWLISDTTFASGQAYVQDGGYIRQPVKLNPDDETTPHTYTITAGARLLATQSYTGQVGKSVTLNYLYPASGSPEEVGTIDSAAVVANGLNPVTGAVLLDYPYTLSTTLEISEPTSSPFSFQVSVDDADDYILGLRLDYVCIDPEGDGSFPGQPGGGGYTPPFVPGCNVVPVPLENSIGPWIFYHWANLKRFFNCDLMKLLNKWFSLFDSFRKTTLNVMRWGIALTHRSANWLTSVFWWLNGSFSNMASGQITTVNNGDPGCHDLICLIAGIFNPGGTNIFDVLLAAINGLLSIAGQIIGLLLALITQAANVLLTVIVGSIVFVIKIVGQILALLKLGQALLASLISAYNNATPIPIPFMPTCVSDPQSSGFCVFFWVADNTIFSGPGVVIVPLLVAIGSIHLIIWVASEIRNTVLSVGSTS